jgi:hypothetical protein
VNVTRSLLTFFAFVCLFDAVAFAQGDDAAYCARLGALAAKYVGGAGGDGGKGPDLNTMGAMADCRNGKYAKGIAYLEKRLRESHVTLPSR